METSTDSTTVWYQSISANNTDINATKYGTTTTTQPTYPLSAVLVPAIMFASGVFGNVLALVVLYRSKKEHRRSVFYRLVGGLACTDLFGTTVLSPVTIIVYLNGMKWVGGQAMCHYFSFMMIFAGMATVLIVGVMAIERYFAIIHPYDYERIFSPGKVMYMLLAVWIFAIITACLPLMGLGTNIRQYPGTWCFFDCRSDKISDKLFTYFYASVGLVVIALTALCNAAVMCVLAQMRRKQNKVSTSSQRGQLDNEAQMIVLLAGIVLVFATCYAPLMVRVIINQTHKFPVNHQADLLTIRLACLNQILDPWVYILLRKGFFTRIWRLVYCVLCCKRKQTTSDAILEKSDQNVKSRPRTSKQNDDDDVFEDDDFDRNGKSPGLQILKDCCTPSVGGPERKSSGRSLLIPMRQYGRYDGHSPIECSDLREVENGNLSQREVMTPSPD